MESAPRPANDNEQGREWTMSDAIAEIKLTQQEVAMGASDSDMAELNSLIVDVTDSRKTPREAVRLAHAIKARSQKH